MKIVFLGPEARRVLLSGQVVVRGEPVDVNESVAARLLAQSCWQRADELGGPADGRVDEVLARVGDDPERARAALEAEQSRPQPRSTLVEQLAAITQDEE